MIIIGIDPGTANTGYGVIKGNLGSKKKNFKYLCSGLIKTDPSFTTPERLRKINIELERIIKDYRPEALVIENVYFFKNLKTVIPVSQAKGVVLLTAAKRKIPVFEFTPLQIKLMMTGYGWSEKKKIQKKVERLLCLKKSPSSDDEADALATALTYFFSKKHVQYKKG